jgi:hypothetical protein
MRWLIWNVRFRADTVDQLRRALPFALGIDSLRNSFREFIMNRPPPYFPQNQLSPPDEKRYRKFKFIVGALAVVLLAVLGAIVFGLYYLISSYL